MKDSKIWIGIVLILIIIGIGVYLYTSDSIPSNLIPAQLSSSSSAATMLSIPSSGVMLGAHIEPENNSTDEAGFTSLEGQLGHNLAIYSDYEDWNPTSAPTGFPNTSLLNWSQQHHLLTMISWRTDFAASSPTGGCATAADITAGKYDSQLTQQADAVKALGYPILVRWHYEMTNNDDDTCFNNGIPIKSDLAKAGQNYVASWKHIVDIFRAQGANNVQWVWSPSANLFSNKNGSVNPTNWKLFYPGDSYVDWIADDNYNKTDKPLSFGSDPDIANFYNQTSGLGKPLMQSETGADHDTTQNPDAQTTWIQTAQIALKTKYPAFKALIWWDGIGSAYQKANPNSNTGYGLQGPGLDAFKQMASDPHFTALPFK